MPNTILDSVANNTSDGPHYNEDVELLNSPDETSSEEEVVESKEVVDPDIDASEEEESDAVESDEEEPVKIAFSRPSIREIKEKFPNFFQEFPDIREAIFREAKFTSIFPTIEDAQEAVNENSAFSTLSDSVLSGDSSSLLDSIFKTDEKAAVAFSASFLPALYKKNQEAYSTVVTPLFENLFRQMYKNSDENMRNSALNAAAFLFGDDAEDIVTGKKTLSKIAQLTEEAKNNAKKKDEDSVVSFKTSAANVSTVVEKGMYNLVSKDFDPDNVFTKVVKDMLIKDIVSRIDKQLQSDASHITVMGAIWKRARGNGYTKGDESKLVSAYLARAKSLIPSVREKVRSAALGKVVKPREIAKKEVNGGASPRSRATALDKRDYRSMTDREILDL